MNKPEMPISADTLACDVKAANRRFYDTIAPVYEKIDGRRSETLGEWLKTTLRSLRSRVSGGILLDLGTGNGFVNRCAEGIFQTRLGSDISPEILRTKPDARDAAVAADVDHLPFRSGSIDTIVAFAVLHHLSGFEGLVSEVARVLKPGGIFYSDHDMDARFRSRFALPLSLYRFLSRGRTKYTVACPGITPEMYALSEFQENGIDAALLVRLFLMAGFTVQTHFHWYGLHPLSDAFFGNTPHRRGHAPLVSLTAVKDISV
ncbi:MAG: class I SAM-dependent methyltransferase [Candidatus Ozemobacteraceae bacterium]